MQPLDLILAALATFYWSQAIVNSDGPFKIFEKARFKLKHGGLLDCVICLSLWVALLFYVLLQTPAEPVVYVSAMAGGSVAVAYATGAIQG